MPKHDRFWDWDWDWFCVHVKTEDLGLMKMKKGEILWVRAAVINRKGRKLCLAARGPDGRLGARRVGADGGWSRRR
jgi:hypothetical protein